MIDSFDGQFAFLSNFFPSPVKMDGIVFPTVEHAFQAAKTSDLGERRKLAAARSAGVAKRMGRKVALRKDWDNVRIGVMLELVRAKFQDPSLRASLLATGDEKLVEGNTWNDKFWGVCDGIGHNHLGQILMQVRKELRLDQ